MCCDNHISDSEMDEYRERMRQRKAQWQARALEQATLKALAIKAQRERAVIDQAEAVVRQVTELEPVTA